MVSYMALCAPHGGDALLLVPLFSLLKGLPLGSMTEEPAE
jgi:hypothetical protein